MTPTQPAPLDDAGAMAVLDMAASLIDHDNPDAPARLRAARAHLAARLAELKVMAEKALERATRAEAELAAVREAAGLNVLGMPVVENPKVPDGYAAIIQGGTVVGVIKVADATDAARGGE